MSQMELEGTHLGCEGTATVLHLSTEHIKATTYQESRMHCIYCEVCCTALTFFAAAWPPKKFFLNAEAVFSNSSKLYCCPSTKPCASSALHIGHSHSPSGTCSSGGDRQNKWHPLSHRSHKMIFSSWWPPLHSSQLSVKMLSGTRIRSEA